MKKTPLHASHTALGAKMGAFAGYDMPLFYPDGVIREHEWVRAEAGLFDVSHMGQIVIEGKGVAEFLERLTPSSFSKAAHGRARYTVLTNEKGGIIDDLIITRLGEHKFFAVINAGCKDKDIAWIRKNLPADLSLEYLEDRALIALQGPKAESVMRDVMKADLSDMPYMTLIETKAPCGTGIFVSRVGYTGEDGFELSVPQERAEAAWAMLLEDRRIKPVGLAARDSLRLEMGYALYGHDIDGDTSPVEAGLGWVMGKHNTGFIGAERVLKDREEGTNRRRAGIRLLDKGVAREGAELRDAADKTIGVLTSGGYSPSLKQSIGQGYIETAHAENGNRIFVNVRGRNIAAEVAALPFIPAKTKSMKKQQAA